MNAIRIEGMIAESGQDHSASASIGYLTLHAGEMTVLTGPPGGGSDTVLHVLHGACAFRGAISVAGHEVTQGASAAQMVQAVVSDAAHVLHHSYDTRPVALLDPTAGLDSDAAREIIRAARNAAHHHRRAVVVCSDDPQVLKRADRVVTFDQGLIVDDLRPATVPLTGPVPILPTTAGIVGTVMGFV